jgi:predicted dehydrogenase
MPRPVSRRRFLQSAAFTAASASLSARSWGRVLGANDRLRVASIGTGGKGWSDLNDTAATPKVQIVALCDIDESKAHLGQAAEKWPDAKTYTDWRKLLADAKSFDAAIVSTPDHMHAPISLPAMQLGKHVQCQKPLTHTVFEARQMRLAAKKYNVVTQMGNQIQSHEAYRTAVKLVHDGVIGKVKEVHSWQSGAMGWILVDDRPAGMEPIPAHVHWDEWLGVAPTRPYLPKIYHSFNWRAWQDFSNGQLGDFGCHILDPVFMALKLTAPTAVRAEATPMNKEIWYRKSKVRWTFPGTEHTADKSIRVTWYDGANHMPSKADLGLEGDVALPGSGSILLGGRPRDVELRLLGPPDRDSAAGKHRLPAARDRSRLGCGEHEADRPRQGPGPAEEAVPQRLGADLDLSRPRSTSADPCLQCGRNSPGPVGPVPPCRGLS